MEETFPELRVTDEDKAGGVAKIDEDRMKSDEGKKKWRDFIQKYENKGMSLLIGLRGEGTILTVFS